MASCSHPGLQLDNPSKKTDPVLQQSYSVPEGGYTYVAFRGSHLEGQQQCEPHCICVKLLRVWLKETGLYPSSYPTGTAGIIPLQLLSTCRLPGSVLGSGHAVCVDRPHIPTGMLEMGLGKQGQCPGGQCLTLGPEEPGQSERPGGSQGLGCHS